MCRAVVGTARGLPDRDAVAAVGDFVLEELRRERLGPLALDVARREAWPADIVAALRAERYAAARRYLVMSAHLDAVLHALARAGIDAIVLKGMALAPSLYGDPSLRPMDDIDVLVRRADALRARDVLGASGHRAALAFVDDLRRRAASMLEGRGVDGRQRVLVDLHWALTDARSGSRGSRWSDSVFDRAEPLDAWRTLSPADHLLHACVHLGVNHGLAGLLRLCDIALMIVRWRDRIDWDWIADTAEAARLRGVVWAALEAARTTLDAPAPAPVTRRLQARGLRQRALGRWFLPRTGAPMLAGQDYVVPLLAMDRGRDCARLLLDRLRA